MSFAQLDMFPSDLPDSGSSTWQRFQERPFEATMNAFSKVNFKFRKLPINSNLFLIKFFILVYNGGEDSVINERLSSSLQDEELAPREDGEDVIHNIPLPPRILSPRILPLSPEQWENFFDQDGVIKESEIIKEMIFSGVSFEVTRT